MADSWCPDNAPNPPDNDTCDAASRTQLSYLCNNGWTPVVITGFLRDFLAMQWSSKDNIINPVFHSYLWNESVTSGILIENTTRFRADVVEKLPAIMIKRNTFRVQRIGINDGLSRSLSTGMYPTQVGAHNVHTNAIVGSHTAFCLGGTAAMADGIAMEVVHHIMELCPAIREHLSLAGCTLAEVGAVQKVKGSVERFGVPVTIAWYYLHTWNLYEESSPLQGVDFKPRFMKDGRLTLFSRQRSN